MGTVYVYVVVILVNILHANWMTVSAGIINATVKDDSNSTVKISHGSSRHTVTPIRSASPLIVTDSHVASDSKQKTTRQTKEELPAGDVQFTSRPSTTKDTTVVSLRDKTPSNHPEEFQDPRLIHFQDPNNAPRDPHNPGFTDFEHDNRFFNVRDPRISNFGSSRPSSASSTTRVTDTNLPTDDSTSFKNPQRDSPSAVQDEFSDPRLSSRPRFTATNARPSFPSHGSPSADELSSGSFDDDFNHGQNDGRFQENIPSLPDHRFSQQRPTSLQTKSTKNFQTNSDNDQGQKFDDGAHKTKDQFDGGSHRPNDQFDDGSHIPRDQFDDGSHRPRDQIDNGSHRPRDQFDNGSHRPRDQFDDGSHSPRDQFDDGSHRPRDQFDDGSHRPRDQFDDGSHRPRDQFDDGSHRPRDQFDDGSHDSRRPLSLPRKPSSQTNNFNFQAPESQFHNFNDAPHSGSGRNSHSSADQPEPFDVNFNGHPPSKEESHPTFQESPRPFSSSGSDSKPPIEESFNDGQSLPSRKPSSTSPHDTNSKFRDSDQFNLSQQQRFVPITQFNDGQFSDFGGFRPQAHNDDQSNFRPTAHRNQQPHSFGGQFNNNEFSDTDPTIFDHRGPSSEEATNFERPRSHHFNEQDESEFDRPHSFDDQPRSPQSTESESSHHGNESPRSQRLHNDDSTNHHSSATNNILGSGNFGVLRGGIFADGSGQSPSVGRHSPFQTSNDDFFSGFRDFQPFGGSLHNALSSQSQKFSNQPLRAAKVSTQRTQTTSNNGQLVSDSFHTNDKNTTLTAKRG